MTSFFSFSFFLICLLIITLNNYIYNTPKKNDTLTRDINRLKQNKLTNYYRAKRNCKKVQRGNEIIRR